MTLPKTALLILSLCSSTFLSASAIAQESYDSDELYDEGYAATSRVNGGYPYNSNTFPVAAPSIAPPIIGSDSAKTPNHSAHNAPIAFTKPVHPEPLQALPIPEVADVPPVTITAPKPAINEYPSPYDSTTSHVSHIPAYSPPLPQPPQKGTLSPLYTQHEHITPPPPAYPVATPSAAAPEGQASLLSEETQDILDGLPRYVAKTGKVNRGRISVNRAKSNEAIDMNTGKTESSESFGMSIAVRKPKFSATYELQRAFDATISGDTTLAASIYERILDNTPRHQDAVFGYATLNQRLENNRLARELYGRLLRLNPKHAEGLNNFLALVIEESPEEALPYLQALIKDNPNFAPAYAQIAKAYQLLGAPEQARRAMSNALALDSDNLVYRYNYAVLLDEQAHYEAASQLYLSLIRASLQGQPIPADIDALQERLRFLQNERLS